MMGRGIVFLQIMHGWVTISSLSIDNAFSQAGQVGTHPASIYVNRNVRILHHSQNHKAIQEPK